MTMPLSGESSEQSPLSQRVSEASRHVGGDKYRELHAQYMDLQRMLAMVIDQHHHGKVTVYHDPQFPRLAYLQATRGNDTTSIVVMKVPE